MTADSQVDRLVALRDLGLTTESDPDMERFARRVRDELGVPVSLVSLVQSGEQVFPGMCGLPAPWDERRSTPLSHSFCQHVVESGRPLVISDARRDPLVQDNLATTEIGVVAYAGMPLIDDAGHVLGSLCAIDTVPRAWDDRQLEMLTDVAHDCTTELRLRLARLDASRERERRDVLEERLRIAIVRTQRLLAIAERFNTTRTVDDVRAGIDGLAHPSLTGVAHITLRLPGDGHEPSTVVLDSADDRRSVVHLVGFAALAEAVGPDIAEHYRQAGLQTVACTEVLGSLGALGAVELGWSGELRLDDGELSMIAALGSYAGQALERAHLIEDRISAAHTLQDAMLSPVPLIDGLDLAAGYLPALSGERVGGDWYDVVVVPRGSDETVCLTVGDVTGHDISAAALMGQARSMLRQAAWDLPSSPPSAHLTALENATAGLDVSLTGTAVLAHLRRTGRGWSMSWSNAGHPPPLVLTPDGTLLATEEHDILLGYPDLVDTPRTDHHLDVPAGGVIVLYTDGMTDRRDTDPQVALAELTALVRSHRHESADTIVRTLTAVHGDGDDDVVCLVVRVPS